MVKAQEQAEQESCAAGVGGRAGAGGSGSRAAEMEAPTLRGQADVTKVKQTPCYRGVTAHSVLCAEPLTGDGSRGGGGGGVGSPKGNLHTEFIRPLRSFKHMLL